RRRRARRDRLGARAAPARAAGPRAGARGPAAAAPGAPLRRGAARLPRDGGAARRGRGSARLEGLARGARRRGRTARERDPAAVPELLRGVSPADPRDEVGRFPVADEAAVDAAVARARRAQVAWCAAGFEARARVLRRFRDLAAEGAEELARL